MKEIKTLQPYNFRELPLEMKEKAEKMIADISPLGEVNEGTVDAVEAWSSEDVLVLMRAMYNEALRQPRPVPSDVQEAAHKAYPVDMLGDVHHPRLMIDRNQTKREDFIEGMLAEHERLMSGSLCGNVDMCGVSAWVELPSKELTDYLRSNFKEGDEVRVIIIKKEDEK